MRPMQDKESGGSVRGRSRRRGSRPAGSAASGRVESAGVKQRTALREAEKETAVGSENGDGDEKRAGNKKRAAVIACCVTLGILAAAGAAYTYAGQKYKEVFFPKTTINGMDASGKSVEEIKQMIADGIRDYALVLETRGGGDEVILGSEIDFHPEYDGTLERLLGEQEPLRWGIDSRELKEYTIGTLMAYDHQKLEEAVNALAVLNPANVTEPTDAKMSEYIEGTGYQIIPEDQGNLLKPEAVLEAAAEAIQSMSDRLVLEDLDAYVKPKVTADDPELVARVESWNHFVKTTVTYRFGSRSEVLSGDTINQWLYDDGTGKAALDESYAVEYVKQLGKKYNTAYQPKELKTSYGKTVKIVGGHYGWRISQNAEANELIAILRSGQSQEREPLYLQKAASHDGPDYGNTYVEINLTAQHLYFYKEGRLLVEADFVSGNESRGWSTPAGAYPLTYKERNATLKGENYATPVSYWMPFNGNIGMHDANWRSSFGGSLYKTGGSHGCVNLPPSAAKTIYENISAGMPVLCYQLPGTEQKTASGSKPAETKPAETKPAETQPNPAETKPAQPNPAETKPAQPNPTETKPAETKPTEPKPQETQPNPAPSVPTPPTNNQSTGGATPTPGNPGAGSNGKPGPGGSGNSGGAPTPGAPGTSGPGGNSSGGTTPTPGGSNSGNASGPGAVTGADRPSSGVVDRPGA